MQFVAHSHVGMSACKSATQLDDSALTVAVSALLRISRENSRVLLLPVALARFRFVVDRRGRCLLGGQTLLLAYLPS
jgi:hypothetical protein